MNRMDGRHGSRIGGLHGAVGGAWGGECEMAILCCANNLGNSD